MSDYCTLDQVKNELKADTAATADEALLRGYMRNVTRRIDQIMGSFRKPYFAPYIDTRYYNITTWRVDNYNNTFWLGENILSRTTVLRGTDTITSVTEVYAIENEVAQHLRITDNCSSWYEVGGYPPHRITVTGVFGWHPDYSNAWDSVDTIQDVGGISAADTSITVADADGADLDGFTPRFSEGQLLKIESEFIEVTAVNTTTNVLTVRRGRNGSTAAAHAISTAIATYWPDDRINRIARRQTAMLYARRGAFQVETIDGVGVITYPQDLLTELKSVLQEFAYG